jgi:hypothetical protein
MLQDAQVQHGGAFPKVADPSALAATQNTVPHWLQQILANQAKDTSAAAIKSALDTLNAAAATSAKQDALKTSVDGTNTKLGDTSTAGTVIYELDQIRQTLVAGGGNATAANQATANTSLASIKTDLDNLNSSVATAAAQATGNTSLAAIKTDLDNLNSTVATATNQGTANTSLAAIKTDLDTLNASVATAALQGTANTSLAAIKTDLDTLNASVATAANQTTANTKLDTLHTDLGTIATNQGSQATAANQATANTSLAAIKTDLDNLNTSVATATAQATGNTSLAAIKTDLDNLNSSVATAALQASSNTKLDIIHTDLGSVVTNQGAQATSANQVTLKASVDSTNTKLGDTATAGTAIYELDQIRQTHATAASQTTGNTSLSSIDTKLSNQATAANQTTLTGLVGDLTATPVANTVIDRLKTIGINTSGLATAVNQVSMNTKLDTLHTDLANNATTTLQSTGNTSLGSIDTKLTNQATAANQATGNTSLASIDTKLTSQSTAANQTTMNTSLGAINTSIGSTNTKLGDTATAGTVIKELDQIRTAQADGTQKALTGKVITSAPADVADATVSYIALDAKQRMRLENTDAVDPWQTFIEKYGSISTASATDVIIANATTVAGGYPAQSIDYTVTALKTFYLKKLVIMLDTPPTGNNHVSISIGGSKKMQYHLKTTANANNSQEFEIKDYWERGYPIAAGTVIQVYVRTDSGAATIFWVRLEGYEEIN